MRPNTDGISMADIKLGAGFETKSEAVQQAMIQRAKELVAKQREKVRCACLLACGVSVRWWWWWWRWPGVRSVC